METDIRVQTMAANIGKIFDTKDIMYVPQKITIECYNDNIEITAERSIRRESLVKLEKIIAEKRAHMEKWDYFISGDYGGKTKLYLTLLNLYHA